MSRRIRVAHCIETMHTGGVEQTRLTLARGLDPERYEQIVICTKALGALPDQFHALGVDVHPVGTFRTRLDWSRVRAVRRLLADYKPDIVHGGVFEGVVMAACGGRLAGVPIVIGEETADPEGRRLSGHLFFRALAAMTDRMVAVSPFVREYLVRRLRVPPAKVRLINNGVPEGEQTSPDRLRDLRAQYGIGPGEVVIGSVGRLFDRQKKVSDIIRSLPLVLRQTPNARLLIVGDGTDRAMLETLAIDTGVAAAVIFAGYQADTRPFFDLMDIFVHAPASEAFGLVVAEAMMAGKPVVATRVGGIPQVVAEGTTALLVPPAHPEELARALLRLLADPGLAAELGRAGRTRAVEQFGWERYVREVDALYGDCLAAKLA
jgi:glycosyltransferase involved in cell wall biosynthesis